jgi:uncharacterized protein YmfQ (DUF2313 family)
MPKGRAWLMDAGKNLTKLIYSFAPEMARVDARIYELLDELDPRTTSEMITDWERVTGLPDSCSVLSTTLEDRRNDVITKMTSIGGQSESYYESLAEREGLSIQKIEYYKIFQVNSKCGDPLYGNAWRYAWKITFDAPEPSPEQKERIECIFDQVRPAHTVPIFVYEV